MKKIFLLISILLSTLYSHECQYKIELDLDIDKGLLQGHATILTDHPSMKLLDSKANISEIQNASLSIINNTPNLITKDLNKTIEIDFTYNFKAINGDAILLESWYPRIDIMCKHETIISNSDVVSIVESTKTEQLKDSKRYTFDYPLDKLNLIASKKYTISSKTTKDGMNLSTYLYAKDSKLSKKYLTKTQEYFSLYKNMFGFLPFNNFSVVETPFPAGYSMPTFTLIGQQIINKDFVLDNSLGHEIAHQWFGNYVYSPAQGNWVEGMTTFYADYLYAKKANKASEYRKSMLIKYNSFVNSENEIALIEFTQKTKESKNAIGYEKATFFFYMLEKKIGKEAFDRGIKKLLKEYPFKVATYKNLREIFEEVSDKKLLDFFKTWVYTKGSLEFQINNIGLMFVENRYILEFDITNNIKTGFIPVSICSDDECLSSKIDLSKTHQRLELDIEPTKIVIDENYEVFRKLDVKEVPPVISKVLNGNAIVVVDREDEKRFAGLKDTFKEFKYADEVTYKELKSNNILVLGANNSLLSQLTMSFKMQGDTKIELFKNPLNNDNVIAIFDMKAPSKYIFYKLKHLGKYSTVILKDGVITQKTTKPSIKGVEYDIWSATYALKPQAKKLPEIIKDIVKSKVVFIGEKHTQFSSHLNQLKIIKAMYKKNKNLAIGMEMFQKPFQKYLDDFIAGKITEKEMIIKTQYFKRWKYDYELYRPIILFAKKNNIQLIALNLDREITKKIVSEGYDELSEKQKTQIPNSIDFANTMYKQQLNAIYGMHQSGNFKDFEEFYHAQLVWDETMATNIVAFLQNNPKSNMAVLAGNGHVMYGYGIPSRIKRRGISDYTIVLNLTTPETGIADYLLYPTSVSTKKAKKVGVFLKSDDDLKVKKLVENSLATKANIKVGDKLIAFNGTKVKNLFDLKTELAFVNGNAKITILRDSKEMDVSIDFSESK